MRSMSGPGPRRRRTATSRETEHLTRSIALALGRTVREARRRRRLSQADLAVRVNVHQSSISRIELGLGGAVSLEVWVGLGVAIGQPLAVTFSRPLGASREPSDAGHLAMQERLLALAKATGRTASFELPTRSADPRYSIDVCVRDTQHRLLIVQEAWNTFGDIGAAIRSTNRKTAEATDLAATIDDGPPYRVAAVWVVRPSAANRTLVARYPETFSSAFPGSSRAWAGALEAGSLPPVRPGLVWLDPATGRISEWRRSR